MPDKAAESGPVAELMQSIDWSRTAVGPVDQWPRSLRGALGILLKQCAPGFILWGAEHVQFYNEAYGSLLGSAKPPAALGQRARECWPEIWDSLQPTLARVRTGESVIVKHCLRLVDREGDPEERYFDYFYSPLEGEAGKVEGVFCLLQDTTPRVVDERRLGTLRNIADLTFEESVDEACKRMAAILSANRCDFPFAAFYLYEDDRKHGRLAGSAGVKAGLARTPSAISFLNGEESAIAQAALKRGGDFVPECGVVLPIFLPGQLQACGFMLAGISPVQRLDEGYRAFIKIVAGQAGAAIAAARVRQEQRRPAHTGIEESERQLRTMVDCIPQLAWMAQPDGHIFWFNRRWYEYTGTTPEQMAGWGWQSVHDPETLPLVLEKWKESLRTGSPFEMEFPLRGADATFRWFLTRVIPLHDDAGQIVRWFGTNTDVTDLKRIRDERTLLLEEEQKARAAAELLNQLGPALVRELEPNTLVQSVTDMAIALTGAEFGAFFHNVIDEKGESYTLYTLSGAPREAFERFPLPRNTGVFGPTFQGEGIVRSEDITQDPRYGKNAPYHGMPAGHLPVKSYLAAPVISLDGNVLGGLFFGHSLPGRFREHHESIVAGIAAQAAVAMDNARLFEQSHWIQNELKRSNEELRRANEDLETFAYSASHDLQEPLRNVAICAQLLQRSAGHLFDKETTKFLDGVLEGAKRMENLVKDLLEYSGATRYAEGPLPNVNAGTILSLVLEDLQGQTDECSATITVGELPVVSMHEVHLKQLFQNLVGNALKYRRKECPRVHISASPQHGWWVFSVADNGIGIDGRFADQIFGLFKRLHSRSEYAGSGIGLSICQRIVEQYGGRIWLEKSVPGEGSVFSFSIPQR